MRGWSTFALVNHANKFAEDRAPWKLVKEDRDKAKSVLVEMARALKLAALALHPFMPTITQEMWHQLGESVPGPGRSGVDRQRDHHVRPRPEDSKGSPLFPRKELL